MKKRIIYLIVLSVILFAGTSCEDYLDITPTELTTLDDVFKNEQNAEAFLNAIYWNLPYEMNFGNYYGSNPFVAGSDEMDEPYSNALMNFINDGSWAPDYPERPGDVMISYTWTSPMQALRKLNIFLEYLHKVPMDETKKTHWRGEALFMRAFMNFCLLRMYGPIPIIDHYYETDSDFSQTVRKPINECIEFILQDLNDAQPLLNMQLISAMGETDQGRPTQASVLALRSRLLLYAASPWWNGNDDYKDFKDLDGNPFFPATYDANKWKMAAEAALDCITKVETAGYGLYQPTGDPYKDYIAVFKDNYNKEILFVRNMGLFNQIEQIAAPRGMNGWSGLCPTQEIIDDYEMEDGSTPITGYNSDGTPIINPASGYSEDGFTGTSDVSPEGYYPNKIFKMWYKREPRFYASISYSQSMWRGRRIDFRSGRADGRVTGPDWTTTGYLMRKFLDETGVNIAQGKYTNKTWIYFRLGEIYLNYAEAINETEGPAKAYPYVNAIRQRAGLPNLAGGLSQSAMREKIRHERRIELAFETHRFFDCRRWKIVEQTDNRAIHGMNVYGATDELFFQRAKVEDRIFVSPKHYLFPIPQEEINKNRTTLLQNIDWEASIPDSGE